MVDTSLETRSTTPPLTRSASRDYLSPDHTVTEEPRTQKPLMYYSEADIARIHKQYAEQIDTLEQVIQEKETLLQRYQQTIADQACEIASLTEELNYHKSRDSCSADPETRTRLLEYMCEARIEKLYKNVRSAIVKINLSVGHLGQLCEKAEQESAAAEDYLNSEEELNVDLTENGRKTEEMEGLKYTRTTIMSTADFKDEAFQESKREIMGAPLLKPAGDQPVKVVFCENCENVWRQVRALQTDILNHKKFISTLKLSIEKLLMEKAYK